jgi:hypothetical protein
MILAARWAGDWGLGIGEEEGRRDCGFGDGVGGRRTTGLRRRRLGRPYGTWKRCVGCDPAMNRWAIVVTCLRHWGNGCYSLAGASGWLGLAGGMREGKGAGATRQSIVLPGDCDGRRGGGGRARGGPSLWATWKWCRCPHRHDADEGVGTTRPGTLSLGKRRPD